MMVAVVMVKWLDLRVFSVFVFVSFSVLFVMHFYSIYIHRRSSSFNCTQKLLLNVYNKYKSFFVLFSVAQEKKVSTLPFCTRSTVTVFRVHERKCCACVFVKCSYYSVTKLFIHVEQHFLCSYSILSLCLPRLSLFRGCIFFCCCWRVLCNKHHIQR